MTWNTPLGHRTLVGIERKIMRLAIGRLSRDIIEEIDVDSVQVGVPVFDSLTGCQQLVMLDYVRKYLFEETPEPNEMSAIVEGSAASVIAYISGNIDYELDCDKEIAADPSIKPMRLWRNLLLKASKQYEWGIKPKRDPYAWEFALENLHERILHDSDYEMDFSDGTPEASNAVNETLGIPKEYFTCIPQPEPDGPAMLDLIRRLLI